MTTAQKVCNISFGFFLIGIIVASFIGIANLPAPAVAVFKTETVIIDGCEYLKFRTYQYDAITHKGNCKNH